MSERLLALAVLLLCAPAAAQVECSASCPDGTRRASYDAVARGEGGVVLAATCEVFCEPILTCTAPSVPRVSADSYACEPLPGYSSIAPDVQVDFAFAAAWDEARALEPPTVPGQCDDGLLSAGEADVDCGGPCLPSTCVGSQRCGADADCTVGPCIAGRCGGLEPYATLGDGPWPAVEAEWAAVVDLGADGVADLLVLDAALNLHVLRRGADGAVASAILPVAGVQSTLRARSYGDGVALAFERRGSNLRGLWWPTDGPAIDVEFGTPNIGHGAATPARLDDGRVPTMLATVVGTGLVPYVFDGETWIAEAPVGPAAFGAGRLDEVATIAAAVDPAYDDVIVQGDDAVWRVARGAGGAYAWDMPQRLADKGDGLFTFASTADGPVDSVGILHLAPPRRLELHVAVGRPGGGLQRLDEMGGGAISDVVFDVDGSPPLDTVRLSRAQLRVQLRAGVSPPVVELGDAYDIAVAGRFDLADGVVLIGPGRAGILRRSLR